MMARAAAGMGVAAEFSSLTATLDGNAMQRVPLQFLSMANLGRSSSSHNSSTSTTSRFMCLAPSALYYHSSNFALNSSPYRSSGFAQLGHSVWQRSTSTTHVQVLRGVAARAQSENDLDSWIKETNSKEPVVVYSKSWCPYCMRVKKLLGSLGYEVEVIELDQDGQPGLQEALERVSGQYTVPNVFIGGKHIGGCDDTVALHSRGQLEPLLQAAGANRN